MEMRRERKENMRGGDGHVLLDHILEKEALGEKCKMYARVTLEKGCSIGYHEHCGESETYFILSGHGFYNDDGTEQVVWSGDVTYTSDGHRRGISNAGEEDLVFMALILAQ